MDDSKILLTPGPCMTSQSVRNAAAGPDLNHRDPEYLNLIRETKSRLLSVYPQTQSGWHAYLLGGSGTLAVEAMITSLIDKGPVLVLENGYYSSRVREILEIHKIPIVAVTHDWLEELDFDRIENALRNGLEAVVVVHNETTTGRLNDIGRLGALCRENGAKCLVDAMSSFGADPIDFTNLDAVCASGNKCLHAIPGVAFVLVRENIVSEMDTVPRQSYYMSLPLYAGDAPPLTPPVPSLAALRQALREYPTDGVAGRHADYTRKAQFIRKQLVARGFMSPISFDGQTCTLSMFNIPSGLTFDRWFDLNLEAGFVIYGCKGWLREKYFQIANMGELSMAQIESWVESVDAVLADRR